MPAKYFSIIRNYVLSVSSQRKYNFYHQNTLLDPFRTNSRNIIGRNTAKVIPLLANQDLTPMLRPLPAFYTVFSTQLQATEQNFLVVFTVVFKAVCTAKKSV